MEAGYVEILVQIGMASITTFLAIMLWPKTHDPPWMFVIAGLVFNYVGIILKSLELFGLSQLDTGVAWLNIVVSVLIGNIHYASISVGLILAYREKTRT